MQPLRSLRAPRITARRRALCVTLCTTLCTPLFATLGALLGAATMPAWAAGAVEVRFVDPQRYADIGWRVLDRERNLERLRTHFQGLAARLPDGQRLAIEVLEVDLAGEEVPGDRLDPVRVLRGRADWPRMRLRWQLSGPGTAARSADEWLADLTYLDRLAPAGSASEALPYDLRMVDDWFQARIVLGQPPR
jgi:hypothetical protein